MLTRPATYSSLLSAWKKTGTFCVFVALKLAISTRLINRDDKDSPPLIQLDSGEIEEGMSGAAVLDLDLGKVVGIISLHYPRNTVDTKLNFAISISSILEDSKAGAILKAKNPGLKLILEFVRDRIRKYMA